MCADVFVFVGGWLAGARGLRAALQSSRECCVVVGGVWLTRSVGVRWCIVGCLGWHMVVVPGPAAGECHGVWWLRVVWVCCVRTG